MIRLWLPVVLLLLYLRLVTAISCVSGWQQAITLHFYLTKTMFVLVSATKQRYKDGMKKQGAYRGSLFSYPSKREIYM